MTEEQSPPQLKPDLSLDMSHSEEQVQVTVEEESEAGWRQDSSVPPGWSYKYNPGNRKTAVMDQAGSTYDGRRNALLHLTKTGQSSGLLDILDSGLAVEGWNTSQHLPGGWKWKYRGLSHSGKRTFYLTDTYQQLHSDFEAAKHIKQKYGEESVKSLETFFAEKKNSAMKNNPSNKTIPKNWELTEKGELKAPGGKIYKNRRVALKEMVTSGLFTRPEVDMMRSCLKFEGWTESPDLPSGWMTKKRNRNKNVMFATSDGDLFQSVVAAVTFVRKYQKYFSEDDIEKIEKLNIRGKREKVDLKTEKVDVKGEKVDVKEEKEWRSPGQLPRGWQVRDCKSTNKIFISPAGQKCNGISGALRLMVNQSFPEEEISQMRDYSTTLGWRVDPTLPSNWLMKRSKKSSYFLGPSGEFFRGKEKVMRHLQIDRNITEKETEKKLNVEAEKKLKRKKLRKDRSSEPWLPSDGTIPEGWKFKQSKSGSGIHLLSPEGQVIPGRRCALKFMNDNNYAVESILEMRNMLADYDDWSSDAQLPQDWLYKQVWRNETAYCSPTGERFRQREKALVFLKTSGASEQDIELLRSFRVGTVDDSTWSEGDSSVPRGWKMKEANIGERKYTLFLSPCHRQIRGRRNALSFMINNIYSESSIEDMRRSLIEYEGWQRDQRLPRNWLVKLNDRSFCSPTGKILRTKEKAIKYLREESGSPEDIEKISQYQKLKSPEDDAVLNEMDDTMDTDTEVTTDDDSVLENELTENETSFASDVSITEEEITIDEDSHFENEFHEDEIKVEDESFEDEVSFESDNSMNTSDDADIDSSLDSSSQAVSKKNPKLSLRSKKLYKNYSTYLLEENFSLLEDVKAELSELGWMDAPELLPEFWMTRFKPGFTNINFLTPSGKTLKSIPDAKKYVNKSGFQFDFDFEKLKERLKSA